jgi:HAD superfamily hydrolase (TIGR01484 family)
MSVEPAGRFQPISGITCNNFAPDIKLVATDMDGTLTRRGKFTSALLKGLETLQQKGLPVVVVTGRSAGWVNGLMHYLPLAGAMAENGGVYFADANAGPEFLVDMLPVATHRHHLADLFQILQEQVPEIQTSADNQFRITDWTFDVTGLAPETLAHLKQTCQTHGYDFTYSTVQCHIFTAGQSKATGLLQVLRRYFPNISPQQVLTVGDSPNDESLFNPEIFPLSVGVANLKDYRENLTYLPTFVTEAAEVDGFLELSQRLLDS